MRLPALCAVLCVIVGCDTGLRPQPPKAVIQGPTRPVQGELVVLDASQSEGARSFRWSISPELKGRQQLIVFDGGKRCQVATYGGDYVVTLAVGNSSGIDLLTWGLAIEGSAPCPPPEPVPPRPDPAPAPSPPPTPPTPGPAPTPIPTPTPPAPGVFGVTPEVARIVNTIQDPDRVAKAGEFAAAADGLAAQIDAGAVKSAPEVINRIGKALDTAGPTWNAARREFSALLERVYKQHAGRGASSDKLAIGASTEFVHPANWAALMRECATGARQAKPLTQGMKP